jgi:hypothetical protein
MCWPARIPEEMAGVDASNPQAPTIPVMGRAADRLTQGYRW